MQANMMQTGSMTTDAALVSAMSSHRDCKDAIVPFASSNDHLEALEYEAVVNLSFCKFRFAWSVGERAKAHSAAGISPTDGPMVGMTP